MREKIVKIKLKNKSVNWVEIKFVLVPNKFFEV